MKRILLALALGVCIPACGGGSSPSATAPSTGTPTRIMVLGGNLSFGAVTVGQHATGLLTIGNTGNSTMTVTGVSLPCGTQYTGSFVSGTIAAGVTQSSTVTFTPTMAETCSGSITVTADQTSGTNTISIIASGVAPSVTVSGTVVDDATSAAIQGGFVSANNSVPTTTSTDGNGFYSIPGLSGTITLSASATGYFSSAMATLTLTGDTRQDFRLRKVAPAPRTRIGAICNDGTLSSATGSGACSSHGGVRCWRYDDGTCTNP
jgi:HYDIN/CFA65/VesB family protein